MGEIDFEGFAIGEDRSEQSKKIDFQNDKLFVDDNCNNCELYPLCPTCYGFNYASTGDVSKRDADLCILTKHCIAAGSYLMYKKLEKCDDKTLSLTPEKRKEILHGIYVVQDYLKRQN